MTATDTAQTVDYGDAFARFRTEDVEKLLQGSYADGINVCVECCDRHVAPGKVALDWFGQDGRQSQHTFAELRDQSARFANFLKAQGIGTGDVIAGMLPRTPELIVTILGTWRAGAVYQPLFTAFGPKAVEHRLQMSKAMLVVTDPANRGKLDEIDAATKRAIKVAIVKGAHDTLAAGDLDFNAELARQATTFEPVMRRGDDAFLMMSTSGTTGLPKGVPVPIKALSSFYVYMRDAIDLRPDDRFWNIADPGWAYGLYYAVTGPLLLGHATTFYDGPFTVESTYNLLRSQGITNLAGAPTAYRLLIAAGSETAAPLKGKLRVVSSAGEPLNPEVIRWFAEHLAAPINDHYGQTETGMVVNNHHGLRHTVRPGSAGLAMPGYRVAVIDDEGREVAPGTPGTLAVDIARSPLLWFTGYWQQPTPAIGGGYYRTGDHVEMDAEGRVSFIGRADDVITSSGYRIGPFDVESALIEHPAVLEAAVIGRPDPERTEVVKAFVVLKSGNKGDAALAEELSQYVKKRLSAHAYPREIDFVEQLPKTPSGKVQRFILRNEEIARARKEAS